MEGTCAKYGVNHRGILQINAGAKTNILLLHCSAIGMARLLLTAPQVCRLIVRAEHDRRGGTEADVSEVVDQRKGNAVQINVCKCARVGRLILVEAAAQMIVASDAPVGCSEGTESTSANITKVTDVYAYVHTCITAVSVNTSKYLLILPYTNIYYIN